MYSVKFKIFEKIFILLTDQALEKWSTRREKGFLNFMNFGSFFTGRPIYACVTCWVKWTYCSQAASTFVCDWAMYTWHYLTFALRTSEEYKFQQLASHLGKFVFLRTSFEHGNVIHSSAHFIPLWITRQQFTVAEISFQSCGLVSTFYYIYIFFCAGKTFQLTFSEWNQKIQANFESKFWIPADICKETNKLVNRAGIYKDSVGATQFWADFQLRCNFPIAMVVVSGCFTCYLCMAVTKDCDGNQKNQETRLIGWFMECMGSIQSKKCIVKPMGISFWCGKGLRRKSKDFLEFHTTTQWLAHTSFRCELSFTWWHLWLIGRSSEVLHIVSVLPETVTSQCSNI